MSNIIHSNSPQETEAAGAMLAARAFPGMIVAFTGDLGAGKTAFCRGFLHALGYTGRVTSPTFAIVNEYDTPDYTVCHFDMYRILEESMLYDIGWEDYLDGETILLIEWSENIPAALPDDCITVQIVHGDTENSRMITIQGGKLE